MTDIRDEEISDVGLRRGPQAATASYLAPDEAFPLELSGISTLELHVLNSRICRQREWEYTSMSGPHSETEERFHDLRAELDARHIVEDEPGR